MSTFEVWSVALGISSVVVNVTLFLVFFGQLKVLTRQASHTAEAELRDHLRRKKQATIEVYAATLEKRTQWRRELADDRNGAAIAALIAGEGAQDGETSFIVREYLSLFEMLATGINADILDEGVIEQLAGGRILAIVTNYWPWIRQRRIRNNAPKLYCEIEALARRIAATRGIVLTLPDE